MLELILATLLGCLAGIVTGLIPGLHTNTLASGLLAMSAFFARYDPLAVAAFLVSLATVHSFVDFIPSLFLGAPDPATALSVLPGHALMNRGLGYKALKLTIIGGLGTFIVCLLSLPLLFLALKPIEPFLKAALPFILLALSAVFIAREKSTQKRVWALIVFLLAGVLGLLALNHLNISQGLFPLLAGLFGLSTLLIAMRRRTLLPPQTAEAHVEVGGRHIFNYLRAAASSLFVSVLPAVGAAQAAYVAKGFSRSKDPEDFLMVVGGINTAAVVFTLAALYLLGKTRTGVMVALSEFVRWDAGGAIWASGDFFLLVLIAAVAAIVGATASAHIGKSFIRRMRMMNYKKISLAVILLVALLVLLVSGWIGLLVLIVATSIGMLAPLAGVRRIHAMGSLVLVVLMWYL